MSVKRIVHVFGELNRGGAETRTMEIYRRIDKSNYQFDFICFGSERKFDYSEEVKQLGGRIFFVKPGLMYEYKNLISIFCQHGPFFAVQSHISHHSAIIMYCAKKAGIRWRITHSRTASDDRRDIFRILYFTVSKFIIKSYANVYLACGKEAGNYLFGHKLTKTGKVTYIPNAIDLSQYESQNEAPGDLKRRLGIPEHKVIIGHVGNLKPVKNQLFLINTFNLYHQYNPESVLVIVGSGELEQTLRENVERLGIDRFVLFMGMRTDVAAIMHTFDIFILPSLYEGVPGVIVEAQAAGVPCMLSSFISHDMDVGTGLLNYLELDKGYLFWSKKINEIINQHHTDKLQCIQLLRKAGYDIDCSVERLIDIYEQLRNR